MHSHLASKFVEDLSDDYTDLRDLCRGSYGAVHSATQRSSGQRVAIKRVARLDNPLIYRHTLREIECLHRLKDDNIVAILDIRQSHGPESLSACYLIQEFMPLDLAMLLYAQRNQSTPSCTDARIERMMHQMLRGLQAVHSAGLVHCDLRPENVLLNENYDVKLCGFGLSRPAESPQAVYESKTGYLGAHRYQAPEVVLRYEYSDKPTDLWSIGCISAEVLATQSSSFGNRNKAREVDHLLELLWPEGRLSKCIDSTASISVIQKFEERKKRLFRQYFTRSHPQALDLLDKLLAFEPGSRITTETALKHAFFSNLNISHAQAAKMDATTIAET